MNIGAVNENHVGAGRCRREVHLQPIPANMAVVQFGPIALFSANLWLRASWGLGALAETAPQSSGA
jgi:hypothetical protein